MQNQNFIVTGAASGIGKATTELLLQRGATVLAMDKVQPEIEGATCVMTDVTRPEQIEEACKDLQTVHGIFNNAGIMLRGKLFDHNLEDVQKVFNINTFGYWNVINAVKDRLTEDASIVLISSKHATKVPEDPAIYAWSKLAVDGLYELLYRHYSWKTQLANLGPIDTNLADFGESAEKIAEEKPMRSAPEFIAKLLVQLIESNNRRLRFDNVAHEYYFQ